jgi:hypothetical protein
MLGYDHAPQDIAALFRSWGGDQPKGFSPSLAHASGWKLNRKLFQSDCLQTLPADAQALAASERWVGVYTGAGAPKQQVAAIARCAIADREISRIRAFREVIISLNKPGYLSHKDLTKLVALDRCERLANATRRRAEDYLMRTAYEGPDVFCQNEPEFAGDEVDPITQ